MALPKQFQINETLTELRKLQRNAIPMIAKRIRVMIEFKKHQQEGISKRNC